MIRPALKIGAVIAGPTCHTRAGPVNRSDRATLSTPNMPVNEIRGKNSAFAAPIRALAATSPCSACRMSGRRSRRSDGSPAGIVGRVVCPSNAVPRGIGAGFRPSRILRRFSV